MNNKDISLSLKELPLTRCGPGEVTDENYWKDIKANESGVWIVMDGFDELQFDVMSDEVLTVTDSGAVASLQEIIKSLITGDLLPDARLLITTRPHRLEPILKYMDRVVECNRLSEEQLFKLLKEVLPSRETHHEVCDFLCEHTDILHMCQIPIHAVSLAKYLNYRKNVSKELFPKTKTELSLFLIQAALIEFSLPHPVFNKYNHEHDKGKHWTT